jgi:hypothetical protein
MNRYGWMVVRAYLPAVAALLLAVLAMFWTSAFGNIDALKTWVPYAKWLPPVALLLALVSGGIATLRMWRWQRGQEPACSGCGGALGRLRHAPTGDYRKCLCCGGKQKTSP